MGKTNSNHFNNEWDTSPKDGAFRMKDYMVWGGSVVKGEDKKYYMFASRWPEKLTMKAWVTNSEIVLAVSDKPAGPYKFEQVILPKRGKEFWDGMMTHNPHIHYHEEKYLLYYIGTTYDFEQPTDTIPTREMYEEANNNQRIGLAVADSPFGPWERMNTPIIDSREDEWDAAMIVNPAVSIEEDGSVMMIYKSAPVKYPERRKNRTMRFGMVKADHYLGPYERPEGNNQMTFFPINTNVEDPYIWYESGKYHMVAKCMNDSITGEKHAGFIAHSSNGIEWEIPHNPIAYSKTIEYKDGSSETLKFMERPPILFDEGKPTHVFFACRNSNWETYNLVRPLRQTDRIFTANE